MTTRRLPALAILALFVAVGLGGGWVYINGSKGDGSDETIPWNLSGMGGANSAAGQEVVGPNVVRVHGEQWPVDVGEDSSWLVPSVSETAAAVTITLRAGPDHPLHINGLDTVGWYDTGGWVNVTLSAPLGSRTLVDGATGKAAT